MKLRSKSSRLNTRETSSSGRKPKKGPTNTTQPSQQARPKNEAWSKVRYGKPSAMPKPSTENSRPITTVRSHGWRNTWMWYGTGCMKLNESFHSRSSSGRMSGTTSELRSRRPQASCTGQARSGTFTSFSFERLVRSLLNRARKSQLRR